jgi:hypothetical protein
MGRMKPRLLVGLAVVACGAAVLWGSPAGHAGDKRARKGRQTECTPGYEPCVPVCSDVDCAGGTGNGPCYVRGPIRVTGEDVYDLDRDGDGVACE